MAQDASPFVGLPKKRSPFPRRSLPQAGDSLREKVYDVYFDRFFIWFTAAVWIGFVAFVELLSRWAHWHFTPWLWAAAALILGALAAVRWLQIRPQIEALVQGLRGERSVGRMLEELRTLGYVVFQDIPGENFNIDHALVGPAGVFAIETKTWSKPGDKRAEIDYDGHRILVNGQTPDRDTVAQAEAVSDYLRDLIKRMSAREVSVRPVVLIPGWWIARQPKGARVWVLNPKALGSFLKNEPQQLSREDIALFVDRLTVHLSAE